MKKSMKNLASKAVKNTSSVKGGNNGGTTTSSINSPTLTVGDYLTGTMDL